MLPLEILLPSLCLNLIYILLKVLEHKEKFKNIVDKLINNKDKLEKSIHSYKESLHLTEFKEDVNEDIILFIDTLTDLTEIINFKTV